VLDPLERAPHGRGCEPHAPHAALTLDGGEARALEHAHVLRHRGQRHVEARGELADRPFAGGEARENLAPGGVGERGERRVERVRVMVNHMVYYRDAAPHAQEALPDYAPRAALNAA
jgi:hypothetical protein